jgi:hypothetical protein
MDFGIALGGARALSAAAANQLANQRLSGYRQSMHSSCHCDATPCQHMGASLERADGGEGARDLTSHRHYRDVVLTCSAPVYSGAHYLRHFGVRGQQSIDLK